MHTARVSFLVLSIAMLMVMHGVALAQTKKAVPKPAKSRVLVDESVLNTFIGEAEKQFQIAHRHFMDGDKKGAAQAMRKAAAYLKLEVARSHGRAKIHLNTAAQSLERIAVSVEQETLRSIKTLERIFADASQALAEHYSRLTKHSQRGKQIKQTGRFLKAAAAHLERGAYWAEGEMKKAGQQAVMKSKRLGEKLSQGADSALSELGKNLETLGTEIEILGKKIKTRN